eukprot:scaffold625_cov324-Pavlova_lutheri.AAC.51
MTNAVVLWLHGLGDTGAGALASRALSLLYTIVHGSATTRGASPPQKGRSEGGRTGCNAVERLTCASTIDGALFHAS